MNNLVVKKGKNNNWIEKFFGNKEFIILMFSLFIPSALQQFITIAVTYVDTFFIAKFAPPNFNFDGVGYIIDSPGSIAKTSLGIATSILNFPLMVLLGAASGIGLVTAQFFGSKDLNRLHQTIVFKFIVCFALTIPFILLMFIIPETLVSVSRNIFNVDAGTNSFFINKIASKYIFYSAPSFLVMIFTYSFAYGYREIGNPKVPLIASICSMCFNIILDPLLIVYETDIENAVRNIALATLACRIIELLVILIFIYVKKNRYLMVFHTKLDWETFKLTMKNSWQVFLNDSLYGFATLFLVMCLLVYDENSHDAFTTVSIIIQFASVIFPGMAASCAVLIGSELGKNNIKKAKLNSVHLIVWGSIITLFFALILLVLSFFINPILSPPPPENSPTYQEWLVNQTLAQQAEWIMMPIIFSQGLFSILYYSIKAGGSKFLFFTDGFVMSIWCILFGALIYTKAINVNNMSPLMIFFLIEFNQVAKAICSLFFYLFTNWARNITIQLK